MLHTSYTVLIVKTGDQALQLAQNCAPLLFLLDYQLPDMTGLQLYDQLHQLPGCEHIPAVLITAHLPDPMLEAMLARREIAGMSKPFTCEMFLQMIDVLLSRTPEQGVPDITFS